MPQIFKHGPFSMGQHDFVVKLGRAARGRAIFPARVVAVARVGPRIYGVGPRVGPRVVPRVVARKHNEDQGHWMATLRLNF